MKNLSRKELSQNTNFHILTLGFHTLPVQAPPHHQGAVGGVAAAQPGRTSLEWCPAINDNVINTLLNSQLISIKDWTLKLQYNVNHQLWLKRYICDDWFFMAPYDTADNDIDTLEINRIGIQMFISYLLGFHAPPIHAPLQSQQGVIKDVTAAQTGRTNPECGSEKHNRSTDTIINFANVNLRLSHTM